MSASFSCPVSAVKSGYFSTPILSEYYFNALAYIV